MIERQGEKRARLLIRVSGFVLAGLCTASMAGAAPSVDLHELNWYVHIDLIDAGAGEDLAYWQNVIDTAVADGNGLLEGGQGPFDQPCCTRLGRSVSVATFGSPGDGLDVIDSLPDQNAMGSVGGSGSNAILVDSITYCGGAAPAAIGCAPQPNCSGNGNDDPDLWMTVTVEALDDGVLPAVIAHERGHNACLGHVSAAECQLMQGSVFIPGQGGCLTVSECEDFRDGRTTTSSGLECGCFDNGGSILGDGTLCTEVAGGICSGGLCDAFAGDAGVQLIAAAAPGTSGGGPPDDALRISALKGEWTTLAQFAPTSDDVRAMAYARDSTTLFAVVPTISDDSIVTVDPVAGTIIAFVGTIANGTHEIVSMAYDPGPTDAAGDDRLLVLEVQSSSTARLYSIDPASPSTAVLLGLVPGSSLDRWTGLAYDDSQDKLVAARGGNPGGLYEIDLSSCPPFDCNASLIPNTGLFMDDVSLAFSPISGMLYVVGTAFSGQRTFYEVRDPTTGTTGETLSLDIFTPAALAAVPEPAFGSALSIGVVGLALAARRRERS